MAHCMAHKNKSTLHNYCLINWFIFYVVSESAESLEIIWLDFRRHVSYYAVLRLMYRPQIIYEYMCVFLPTCELS